MGTPISAEDARLANQWRERLVTMPDDELRAVAMDEANRLVIRDMAQTIIESRADAQRTADIEAAERGIAERAAAREAARAVSAPSEQAPAPDPIAASANQGAAERFAMWMTAAGFPARARQTQAVQGRKVRDGWSVNLRDEDEEIGVVACWWGRGHFTAFAEIAGHRERTEEAAELLVRLLRAARGE